MKKLYNAMACICFCVLMVGIGAMDSEDLRLPIVMVMCGIFGTYVFSRWAHED